MSIISILAKFNGTDVQTGLERLGASAQKFSNDLEKSLGGASLVRGLATALAGLNLGEVIAAPFEQAMRYSQRMAENAERAALATRSAISSNTSAEGKSQLTKGDVTYATARIGQIDAELNEKNPWYKFWKQDLADYEGAPMVKSASAKIYEKLQGVPIVGGLFDNPAAPNRMFERRASLEQERSQLMAQITTSSGTLTAEQREIARANRQAGYEGQRAGEGRAVALGNMSSSEAQQKEIDRLSREYALAMTDPTKSFADREAARTAADRAQNALIPIQAREDMARIQGIMPQISASSLARVGGGGNVNVFGGREGALEIEARQHTQLLRTIAVNTAKGGANQEIE